MSRTQKIISEPKKLVNNTIRLATQPYQNLEEEEAIKLALEDFKISEKEKDLLEAELEKPAEARNKAIISKYSNRVLEVLNGYPDIGKSKFSVTATAPDDPLIKFSERPQPWFAKINFNQNGSNFEFKFPIQQYATSEDGSVLYKIDNTDTIIDQSGDIIENLSQSITPYVILKNFIDGDTVLASEFNNGEYYDFRFQNFLVKSEKMKEDKKKKKRSNSSGQDLQLQKISKYTGDVEYYNSSGEKLSAKGIEDVKTKLRDIGAETYVDPIPENDLFLDFVWYSGGRTSWLLLGNFDLKRRKVLTARYLTGVANTANYLAMEFGDFKKSYMKSANEITRFITRKNQEAMSKYREEPDPDEVD